MAIVPLSNILMLVALSRSRIVHANRLVWLNAFAIGIALFYTVLYLPLTPVAPILLIWLGLGFLPVAPALSLVAAIWARRVLIRSVARHNAPRIPRVWSGIALALAMLVAADMHFSVTRIGLHLAMSQDIDSRQLGLRILRAVGHEDLMLRLCYVRSGMSTDLIGMLLASGDPVSTDQARTIFYQVTGTPFNEKPAPKARAGRDWSMRFDGDRGGDRVGRKVEGVALASSRIDGSIDADATTGYLEWTMVLKNEGTEQQEGRGQIALPPGAVVSRVTLWIDGEEREAAFGGRAQVRQAYERVVRRQRDPVLVTTAGKDRVLFQLFPIQPRGEMKVRIGMTVPMVVTDLAQAQLQLPAFRERNFEVNPTLRHAVWLESKTALDGSGELKQEHPSPELWAVRGAIADAVLGKKVSVVTARRDSAITTVWTDDQKSERKQIVLQRYNRHPAWTPRHAVLVIDGSRAMADARLQIAEALAHLPLNIALSIVIAGDETVTLSKPGGLDAAVGAAAIEKFAFAGGRGNLEALTQAWDLASAAPNGVIVWIHGPQPVLLEPVDPLLQRFERRPHLVRLIQFETVAGANRIAEKMDGAVPVTMAPRLGTVAEDLRRLFGQWQSTARQVTVTRERVSADAAGFPRITKTSNHIARLWAADQVAAMVQAGKPVRREAATLLAQRYQLVTPLTGAVVLETRQQYTDAGLEPVAPGTVPTIPEPETWMLMFLVLCLLGWQTVRHGACRVCRVPR
ncbi:MAG: hypothetical protein A3I66_19585 [Burkholderiales bacterium RIFCSPLOWO2_02_FULL_57_36]|nr:MAG: hypothetical protein A3I66_19585 [Burkholderiales bacterium RIFCSPLOWO2_02_FULL_57_36]